MKIENALGALGIHKKESPIEPFKRTLALADIEHEKAVKKLLDATNELVRAYREPCRDCPASNCEGCPYYAKP